MGNNHTGKEIWSFFTGAMGLDLGLEEAGLAPTLANEVEKKFCDTIRANRPDVDLIEADISSLTGSELRRHRKFDGEVHLMVGGPPCQPFSSGGKRAALSDPRGNLLYEFIRLVSEVQPKYFVLENVGNLATAALRHRPIAERPGKNWNLSSYNKKNGSNHSGLKPLAPDELSGSALKQILLDIAKLGYHTAFSVVDAAEYGAPQHRLRFVMFGYNGAIAPRMTEPSHGLDAIPFATVRNAIADLESTPGIHSEYTDRMRYFFELVPEGGNWRDLPKSVQPIAMGGSYKSGGGKTGFFRRLAWDRPSPTVTGRANRKGSAMCHPVASRPLSVRECARLQGFHDDWEFTGALNTQYLQIGNAVPVHLGRAIGKSIKEHEIAISRQSGASANPAVLDDSEMFERAVQKIRFAARNRRARKLAA